MEIVIAPFSNSAIRDWPVDHFARLTGLLLDRLNADTRIALVGTANQRLAANEIVRPFPTARVSNLCGRLPWPEVVARVRDAAGLIGNNSGLTHLAGWFGVPTVCVFGGSHQRREWRTRGANVVIVSRSIGCSPCQLDHRGVSPYDKACLRLIAPETVADAVMLVLDRQERLRAGEAA